MSHTVELKECTECKVEKPRTSAYFRQRNLIDGRPTFASRCKACFMRAKRRLSAARAIVWKAEGASVEEASSRFEEVHAEMEREFGPSITWTPATHYECSQRLAGNHPRVRARYTARIEPHAGVTVDERPIDFGDPRFRLPLPVVHLVSSLEAEHGPRASWDERVLTLCAKALAPLAADARA